jgi:hypothetical protein
MNKNIRKIRLYRLLVVAVIWGLFGLWTWNKNQQEKTERRQAKKEFKKELAVWVDTPSLQHYYSIQASLPPGSIPFYVRPSAKVIGFSEDSIDLQVTATNLFTYLAPDSLRRHFTHSEFPFDTFTLSKTELKGLIKGKKMEVVCAGDSMVWMRVLKIVKKPPLE